jgi:hypothetical protein
MAASQPKFERRVALLAAAALAGCAAPRISPPKEELCPKPPSLNRP